MKPIILVVEDDVDLAAALDVTLSGAGYQVECAGDGTKALQRLDTIAADVRLVLSDVRMRPMDGYTLLAELRQRHPDLPVVMMTAYGTIAEAVEALHGGARDYLEKPFEAGLLIDKVRAHLRLVPRGGLVAESSAMRRTIALARRVAGTDVSVMLTGPSGSGKEVMARFIHDVSARADGPFVAINCAAIPESLIEATLMGHEKGAFTGAVRSSPGKFEQANGGTILLDEITEIPVGLQAKLLRILQERELERVGGRQCIPLDIRVIAASNRDLDQAVAERILREDLYYRLNVFPLVLPSLSERPADVIPLALNVLARWRCTYGEGPSGLSAAARQALEAYQWPGNVRELENVMQRAIVLGGSGLIEADMFGLPSPSVGRECSGLNNELRKHERERIRAALQVTDGVRSVAAHNLGISPRTLRHKLKQFRDAGEPIIEVGRG